MKKTYKNSVSTKKKICSTYLGMLSQKQKFSVTDVVRESKVNRGTFYLHFKNLQDVQNCIVADLSENFRGLESNFRQTDISVNPEIIFERLNSILARDIAYYRLIVKTGDQIRLMDRIKHYIMVSISNNFEIMKYVTNFDSFKLAVNYIVGGIMDCYTEWFKDNIKCNLDELSNFLSNLIKFGLRGVINYGN